MPIAVVLICATLIHLGEGPGLLRLHSTYRHDLKIYSSEEGRVQVNGSISSCNDRLLHTHMHNLFRNEKTMSNKNC
jgi:hypothetical protein